MFNNKIAPEDDEALNKIHPLSARTNRTVSSAASRGARTSVKFNLPEEGDSQSGSQKGSGFLRVSASADAELSPHSRRRTFVFQEDGKPLPTRDPSSHSLNVNSTPAIATSSRKPSVDTQKRQFLANITEAALEDSDVEETSETDTATDRVVSTTLSYSMIIYVIQVYRI
jgi:hypothetical protein